MWFKMALCNSHAFGPLLQLLVSVNDRVICIMNIGMLVQSNLFPSDIFLKVVENEYMYVQTMEGSEEGSHEKLYTWHSSSF